MTAGASRSSPARPAPDVTYLVPVKVARPAVDEEFAGYLTWLSAQLPVVVADGSTAAVFAANHERWGGAVRHIAVRSRSLNGKVAGVCDAVAAAQTPYLIVADDDVRYDAAAIDAVTALLALHDVVVPQNYFSPMRWHTYWDTGRALVNRAVGGDYAGTVAIRRSVLASTGGYCGAVLFENLELMRTVSAHGFGVHRALDVFVARRPPSLGHFVGQRVRQAYDSLAQPGRLMVELALLPLFVAGARRTRAFPVVVTATIMVVAERGRRRNGGRHVFPPLATACAPLWAAERAVCSWLALGCLARGGVSYSGARLSRSAHSEARLAASLCPEDVCTCDLVLRDTPSRCPTP